MGWSSGSELAEDVWCAVRKHIPKDKRKKLAKKILQLFEDHDCDTMYECEKLMKDAGYSVEELE